MERRGRRGRLEARLDLRPEAAQELDVVRELGLALAFRVRSQDEPARRKRDGAERRTEPVPLALVADPARDADRSEEHTSELQSQSNLVCRLLLEKKKQRRHPASISIGGMVAQTHQSITNTHVTRLS